MKNLEYFLIETYSTQGKGYMVQIFGNYDSELPFSEEYLAIGFSPSSVALKHRWRNNGLSASFMADYLTTFFPDSDTENNFKKRKRIKGATNYIANELLENAMKFNDEASRFPVSIQLRLYSDHIVFLVTNSIPTSAVEKFQRLIDQLIHSDPQELYLYQLEQNAVDESNQHSGLGLLTMINDYEAKLGWKFETIEQNPDLIAVTTMVQLTV